jgi:hypothetical protein
LALRRTSNPKGIGYKTFPYTFIPRFNKIFLFDIYHAFEVEEGFGCERRQTHGDFMDNFNILKNDILYAKMSFIKLINYSIP